MEKKKLLELAKQLNGLKDKDDNSLAAKKVKTVAVNDDKLKASFLDACESIPEEKEELIPDDISDAYNEIIKDDPREEVKETKEEEAKPTPKKRTEAKEKATKNTQTSKDPAKAKDKPAINKGEAKKDEKKKEAVKDNNKLKDEYGFIKGTVKSNFIKSIKEKSGTMNEICSREWNINKKPQGGYFKEFEKMGIVKRENGIISFIKK